MWKVLAPLIILVIILMIQLQVSESFTTGSGSSRTSTDASGNTTDASGNQITTPSAKTTISLSLADLLTLFKVTAPAPAPVPVPAPAPTPTTSTTMIQDETTPSEFYNKIRPQLLNDIIGITNTNMSGSPYEPAGPLPCDAPISDSAAQGAELQNVLKDYVKRDEVPCYGCTL